MNKNQIKGRSEQVKGKSKEVAGDIVGNKRLETEGRIQKVGGRVEAGYGDFKRNVHKSNRKG